MGGRGGASGRNGKSSFGSFSKLEGSEKQVSWAGEIRTKMYGTLESELNLNYSANRIGNERAAMMSVLKDELKGVKSAKFFIDNKDLKQKDMVQSLMKEFNFNGRREEIKNLSKKYL